MEGGREDSSVWWVGWEVECDMVWYDGLLYDGGPVNPNGMVSQKTS